MKTLWYTVALDNDNLQLAEKMIASFKKFHPNIDVTIFNLEDLRNMVKIPYWDHSFRITPPIMRHVLQEYDYAVRLDADQIITGNLEHILEGDYDVAVVQNSSPYDWETHFRSTGQRLSLYDLSPLDYVNCGFVVMKSKRIAEHWFNLCHQPWFINYPFREQDLLNILVHYFNYKVKFLDRQPDNKWHGLVSKGYWHLIEKKGDKLILPKNEEWPTDTDKEIVCLHCAGGGMGVHKFKDIYIRFQAPVAKYLESLMK